MQELRERYIRAKRALFDKAYMTLNENQRRAVFTVNGPLLILAGAGSGKTTVLVKRIAFIIKYGDAYMSEETPADLSEESVKRLESALSLSAEEIERILPAFANNPCPPWRMLAITFTNKAAGEIKSRICASLDDENLAGEIWSGTFHSMCVRILRMHGEKMGYLPGFSIYDADDSKRAISACMKELNIDDKSLPVRSVQNEISRAKDRLLTPELYFAEAGNDFRRKQIGKIYEKYAERLKAANALDFDDIIMQTVFLLRDFEDVRSYFQNKFKYVCVDEYQDTNEAQFALTALLSGGYRNLMVVGDDDQSIYKFRGATIENILNFDRIFPDASVIKLEQNYRSTQTILDAANSVIGNNIGRKGKKLWTESDSGEKIHLKKLFDQNEEARYIAERITKLVASGKSFRDFAILYRNNAQSSTLERTFAKSGIPYRIIGGLRFSDRKEIRDIVAYLQLINNHSDNERLLRIINEPRRKIGERTLDGVRAIANEQNCSMFKVIEDAKKYTALSKSASTLTAFAELINELTELSKSAPLEVLVNQVLNKSGYRQMLIAAGEVERDRLENIEEFLTGVIEYQNNFAEEENGVTPLSGFLEETALVADVDRYDESADATVMMTVHSAKGLEFPFVFLPGMEDGIFPGMQAITGSQAEIEEERRLAYVAITRAKKELFITHTVQRMLYGRTQYNPPSRFLEEIPKELIKSENPPSQKKNNALGGFAKSFSQPTDTLSINITRKPVQQSNSLFEEGDRVLHPTFGEGDIISVKRMGADWLYEIIFDKVGTKKLMASFAKLKKI